MASETIVNDVNNFLKKYPPFDLMKREVLLALSSQVSMQYYEENQPLFEQGDKPFPYFFVVNKGNIHIFEYQNGKQELVDKCDEGDIFGVRASMANDGYLAKAVAAEDSLLYTIPMEPFNEILEANPKISLFLASGFASGVSILKSENSFNVSHVRRFMEQKGDNPREFIETDTLDLHSQKEVVSCTPNHTVREAAKIMSIFNVGSILITNDQKHPRGIITDTDFRKKVVSSDDMVKNKLVTEIMTSPVKTIKPGLSVAEAMLLMISERVSHFCVTEDGSSDSPAIGMISQRDILIAQGNNPAVLAKQLLKTNNISQLANIREKAEYLVRSYLQKEVSVPFVANIITAINDVLIQKAAQMAQAKLEEQGKPMPDVHFSWMSLGSEGRKEQLLRTDQDNALVYAEPPEDQAESIKEYFLAYSREIRDILIACGFVSCPADMMASNPKWCLSLSEWKQNFQGWIREPDMKSLMMTSIFFDFRPVVGESYLAEELKEFIFEQIEKDDLFLARLAKNALQNPPPLSFFRGFIVEKSGDHKNEFDIKARAMMPLTDAARVLAYEFRLKNYHSTFERFLEVGKRDKNLGDICEAAAIAYEILIRQRALSGLNNQNSGRYINPDELNKLDRQTLRNTFKTIEKLQQILEIRYRLNYIR
ncbi:MAG: DUF294 nucleotidyltransferase-like domain-containing protein [Bacteroidota bacterium]